MAERYRLASEITDDDRPYEAALPKYVVADAADARGAPLQGAARASVPPPPVARRGLDFERGQ